jgi:hypothetical protein
MSVDGANLSTSSAFALDSGSDQLNWYESQNRFLGIGNHTLTVSASGNQTVFDKIVMISSTKGPGRLEDFAQGSSTNLEMTKIATTEYTAKITSESPAFVVLGETYHSDWNAYVNGVKLSHLPLPFQMYWSNVFFLGKSGQNLVDISFGRQVMRNTLVAFWAVGWASSLAYIGISSRSGIARMILKLKKSFRRRS